MNPVRCTDLVAAPRIAPLHEEPRGFAASLLVGQSDFEETTTRRDLSLHRIALLDHQRRQRGAMRYADNRVAEFGRCRRCRLARIAPNLDHLTSSNRHRSPR